MKTTLSLQVQSYLVYFEFTINDLFDFWIFFLEKTMLKSGQAANKKFQIIVEKPP